MAPPPIDKDKLRTYLRTCQGDRLFVFLDRAIELLPNSKLIKLIEGYASPDQFRPDTSSSVRLLAAVKRFHAASLRGEYYEDFDVNSKNFMDHSCGTQAWIAACHRYLDGCVAAVEEERLDEARTALELIFDLLRQIDECRDDILFFADEAGSWQVGVHWRSVLPAWFRCVAANASAEEYAAVVRSAVREFAPNDAKLLLAAARKVATKEQRAAFAC